VAEAPGLSALYNQYADQGFMVITLLGENMASMPPSTSQLAGWANAYGSNHPVVADPYFQVTSRYISGSTIGLPSMTLLGPGMEVLIRDSWVSDWQVAQALP
jgi:hypothetical protein